MKDGVSDELIEDEASSFVVNIPGEGNSSKSDESHYPSLRLADYWFGQQVDTAMTISCHVLTDAIKHFQRYETLSDIPTHGRYWIRSSQLERDLFLRGAVALTNVDAHLRNDPTKFPLVEHSRMIFPGSTFDPTKEFVRNLKQRQGEEAEVWHCWSMHDNTGPDHDQTLIRICDSSLSSRWCDQIILFKIYRSFVPKSDDIYDLLLCAMAGAGFDAMSGFLRSGVGPPRRPKKVIVSFRLRQSFPKLAKLLEEIDVDCELDSEDNLRFACAQNQTDFLTGLPLDGEDFNTTLVGQRVGITDLRSRSDLNGRVGRVIAWHNDTGRWEVNLEKFTASEKKERVAVRPGNIAQAPQSFLDTSEYLAYRAMVRGCNEVNKYERRHVSALTLAKLRPATGCNTEHDTCAICQRSTSEESGVEQSVLEAAGATRLPCRHSFHMNCIIPWLVDEKTECPCCRHQF